MRWSDLQLLTSVASTGSFTRAAERCQIARSSASRRVAELEGRLGATLFDRSRRRVVPTPAGERFLVHAHLALTSAQDAVRSIDPAAGLLGSLRVSSAPVLSTLVAMPAVLQVLDRHPGVHIELDVRSGYLDLELERIDVALRLGTDARAHHGVVLGTVPFVLCGSAHHPGPVDVEHLTPDQVLGPDAPITLRRGDQEHRLVPRGRVRTPDYGALLAAVRAGHGVARVPAPMLRGHRDVVPILEDWDAGGSTLRCLHRSTRPLVMELVDAVRAAPMLRALVV